MEDVKKTSPEKRKHRSSAEDEQLPRKRSQKEHKEHKTVEHEQKLTPEKRTLDSIAEEEKQKPEKRKLRSPKEQKEHDEPLKSWYVAEDEKDAPVHKLSTTLLATLIKDKCGSFEKIQSMYTVKYSDKIEHVWGTLISNMYMGAPIVSDDGHLEGCVDLVDIALYIVTTFGRPMVRGGKKVRELSEDMAKELQIWTEMTVRSIKQFSCAARRPDSIKECYSYYSIMGALEPLAREQGIHRVYVVESPQSRKLCNLITQSQAVKFVFDNLGHFGSKKNRKLEECTGVLKPRGVYAVTQDTMVLEAFEHMLANNISAVCVLKDTEPTMVGVLSLKDIQVLGSRWEHLDRLYGKCSDFMRHVAQFEDQEASTKHILTKWTVNKGDTLNKTVRHMHEKGVRHVFLLDPQQAPIGVVAMKDVLLELLS